MTKQLKPIITALLLVILGFTLGAGVVSSPVFGDTLQQREGLSELERTLAAIYDYVTPSVVSISVIGEQLDADGFPTGGTGTGFVYDKNGHIITNYHVVDGAGSIEVNFVDGTITRATIVGMDADSDLAVIKVDLPAERLFPVEFGNMDDLVPGQQVVALGSPFGQDWTLTLGIISALNRTIQGLGVYSIGSAIQTDAPINPGNSGGPLLNLRGEVIGVNAQIISENRANSGIGFAIPIDLVKRVVPELIETGEVSYSVIGIRGGDMYLLAMESLGLPNNQRGVVVTEVLSNSPAQDAGLRSMVIDERDPDDLLDDIIESADVLTAIDDFELTGIASLIAYLARSTRPGDVVNFTVIRDGQTIIVPLTLGRRGQ